MRALRFFAIALAVMLTADAVVITFVMRPLFKAVLGDGMLDVLRLLPAALFYLIHAAGLTWFGLRASDARQAAIDGAVIGLVSYACYEMTSWTIMRDWALHLVVIDIVWGTVLSGMACGVARRPRLLW